MLVLEQFYRRGEQETRNTKRKKEGNGSVSLTPKFHPMMEFIITFSMQKLRIY
jgi:hypothetical protein